MIRPGNMKQHCKDFVMLGHNAHEGQAVEMDDPAGDRSPGTGISC